MAATKKLPAKKRVIPLSKDGQLLLTSQTGPIAEIIGSVPISMDIDTMSSATQAVLLTDSIQMEVKAPTKKQIERALGRLIGGKAFRYTLPPLEFAGEPYKLQVYWLAGLIDLVKFATLLQAEDPELVLLSNGVLITLEEDSLVPVFS